MFSFRWGIELFDNFHTQIPNWILEYYHQVGVSNTEMMFIIHLASFHYESEKGQATPAINTTLKKRMNYTSTQGIAKIKNSLIDKGFLDVEQRSGTTSIYDFTGFSRAVMRCALTDEAKVDPLTKVRDPLQQKLGTPPNKSWNEEEKRKEAQEKDSSAEEFAKIAQTWEANFGLLSPIIKDSLIAALEQYPADWITEAMERAVRQNVRRWAYVDGILKKWEAVGGPQQDAPKSANGKQQPKRKYIERPAK